MARSPLLAASLAYLATSEPTAMRADDTATGYCGVYGRGTISAFVDLYNLPQEPVLSKDDYYRELKALDIEELYHDLADLIHDSHPCWPADGPQDGDIASYAGLFGRLAWHCSGTFRKIGSTYAGGCEGARQRHWPENEWRDNVNLDKARSLLTFVKDKYGGRISWGDLMTFAGTVGIKVSGGPVKKFCFGRVDDGNGYGSKKLGVEGTNACRGRCTTDSPCPNSFLWPEQDESDNRRCNISQGGRDQGSHSVGLIYVYPEGPQLKSSHPDYNPKWVHNRSPKLSALEVRDTFKTRMTWSDRETVAIIGGGHTLGRTHGNCNLTGTRWEGYNGKGPRFEAAPGLGRGPIDGTCGTGALAGLGPNTVSSGFEGPWTRTPSRWNYDYFQAMLDEKWTPVKSPSGNDQWWTEDRSSLYAHTRRLTADMSLVNDPIYKPIVEEYARDHARFDSDFADAWYKLVHRSEAHPHESDLEEDAGVCTHFEWLSSEVTV